MTRRGLLTAGAAAASLIVTGKAARAGLAGLAATTTIAGYGPFKMGLQSYSLRGLTSDGKADLDKALDATQKLGLHFWEAYNAHIPVTLDGDEIKTYKDETEEHGVKVNGYGVVHFGKDEAANRKIFEFAKAYGLGYLSADPDEDSFDLLDKLVEEYDVPVGIHNHGPGHKWALIDTIAKAIKDHSPKIGCCIDTGHFLRSKEDPVRAVEVFGKRVYGVHLKDVKDAEHFTILGKGDLRTADLLKALAANQYSYCLALEYEENPENPIEDIKECLEATKKAVTAAGLV
jgi:sugar phosphate isomerase/epimerase